MWTRGLTVQVQHTGNLRLWIQEAMMRVASKKFPDGNMPEELGAYLLHSMDTSTKKAVKAKIDRNSVALDLGNDKVTQDEGAWGRNTSVVLLDQDTVTTQYRLIGLLLSHLI